MLYMPAKLPESIYDPLEASAPGFADAKLAGEFRGGLGMIMVVRYLDTPTGPYDELLIIPGAFSVPGKPAKTTLKRISRIYVSQRDTCYNGRLNWNIPKHLARFVFSSPSSSNPQSLTISVYPPDSTGSMPFFSATLTPFRWIPAIPFSTRYLPISTTLAQPPLPAAPATSAVHSPLSNNPKPRDPYMFDRDEAELLVGTERWCTMPIHAYSPKARGCWVEVHGPGFRPENDSSKTVTETAAQRVPEPEDGEREEENPESASKPTKEKAVAEAKKWWPVDVKPLRIGLWMENADITIPAPSEWKL